MKSKYFLCSAIFVLTANIVLLSATAIAQEQRSYQCTRGDLTRRVEIVSEPGVSVPCEVHYYKDSEMPGEQQVLWRAINEEGYCESKTQDFIVSLGETGWDCRNGSERRAEFRDSEIELDGGENESAPAESSEGVNTEDESEAAEEMDDTDDLAPAEQPR